MRDAAAPRPRPARRVHPRPRSAPAAEATTRTRGRPRASAPRSPSPPAERRSPPSPASPAARARPAARRAWRPTGIATGVPRPPGASREPPRRDAPGSSATARAGAHPPRRAPTAPPRARPARPDSHEAAPPRWRQGAVLAPAFSGVRPVPSVAWVHTHQRGVAPSTRRPCYRPSRARRRNVRRPPGACTDARRTAKLWQFRGWRYRAACYSRGQSLSHRTSFSFSKLPRRGRLRQSGSTAKEPPQ